MDTYVLVALFGLREKRGELNSIFAAMDNLPALLSGRYVKQRRALVLLADRLLSERHTHGTQRHRRCIAQAVGSEKR